VRGLNKNGAALAYTPFLVLILPTIHPRAKAHRGEEQKQMAKSSGGFSLVELLIVVAIILVIAAIAIPNLMRAKMTANESSAVGSLRTIDTDEVAYVTAFPTVGFAPLSALGGANPCTPSTTTGCFLDPFLATNGNGNGKDGYSFTITSPSMTGYNANADALAINQTGTRSFCTDQNAVIYFLPGSNGCSTSTGQPLQ
jgi:type IV pilus assembly protein PilA